MLLPFSASADYYGGSITLNVGDSWRVFAAGSGNSVINGTASWSKTGTAFSITSRSNKSCTIRANYAGSGTLKWSGIVDNYNQDWYWDITVKDTTPDVNPDDNPDDNPNNLDIPDEPSEKWSDAGNYSYSWYKKDLEEYTISTNIELAGMAYLINNGYTDFEGKTIKLSNDIDLSGKKWVQCNTFKGTFDGQGHMVYGVYMGKDIEGQKRFGFWQYLLEATISNLIIQGVANYKYEKWDEQETYAGGLAGYAIGSNIQQCVVIMDLFYSRGNMNSNKDHPIYTTFVNIGGICGYSDRSSQVEGGISVYNGGAIVNSVFSGSISCSCTVKENYAPNGIDIAGICPYAYSVKNCESIITKIHLDDNAERGEIRISGIGHTQVNKYLGNVECCRSIIDLVDIYGTAEKKTWSNENNYYVNGITTSIPYNAAPSNVINCYASVRKTTLKVKNNSKFYIGGISSIGSAIASFSNSNIDVDCNASLVRGFDGVTAYTFEQMKTSEFLEELNMYSTLEMDGPVWKQKEGDYPYINDFWNNEPIHNENKCATPTISYLNGKLTFECETEGVEFKSYITDTDISVYTSSSIDLTATYHISVYATKEGFEDSDVATATLCWVDVDPYADGTKEAEDKVTEIKAMPILMQANGNNITVQGVSEGMEIGVYGIDGIKHGSAMAGKDRTKIPTNLLPGSTAIVKVGEKAVKVIVK